MPVGIRHRACDLAPAIGEEVQRPRRGDGRVELAHAARRGVARIGEQRLALGLAPDVELLKIGAAHIDFAADLDRSEEHTSELQSLMRISYAVFCLKKKKISNIKQNEQY